MKTLGEISAVLEERGLLKRTAGAEFDKKKNVEFVTCDSRRVREGTLFICKGAAFRPEYLQEAADCGCAAYLAEKVIDTKQPLPGLIVTDIRKTMAVVSSAVFGYSKGRPMLTGITGTKGKTTTAWFLKAMLDAWQRELGKKETGLLSTVSNYDGKIREDAVMTTPEAPELHEYLANAREAGISHMTMEVSSQALKYKRVREVRFQVGIFLNISEDHISPQEHEDFEDYFSAKLSMFRQTETACIDLDSDYAKRILQAAHKAERIVTFGRSPQADLRCTNIRISNGVLQFRVICDRFNEMFELAMKGKFNIENAMAAIAAAYVYGVPVSCMKQALACTTVPGRMEVFTSGDGRICGIVDFAHNRLSFEKLFDAVFQEYHTYSKIITVFGCPGGKALNRRRELGLIAGLFSDYVCITSDDPGTECVEQIAEEVRSYVEMTGCACTSISERREAVCHAVERAAAGREKTLILLLGRGSEKFQKIGNRLYDAPTDAELMADALAKYAKRK